MDRRASRRGRRCRRSRRRRRRRRRSWRWRRRGRRSGRRRRRRGRTVASAERGGSATRAPRQANGERRGRRRRPGARRGERRILGDRRESRRRAAPRPGRRERSRGREALGQRTGRAARAGRCSAEVPPERSGGTRRRRRRAARAITAPGAHPRIARDLRLVAGTPARICARARWRSDHPRDGVYRDHQVERDVDEILSEQLQIRRHFAKITASPLCDRRFRLFRLAPRFHARPPSAQP